MDHGVVVPFPLINRQVVPGFLRGLYDNTLTGDLQYDIGQIVDLSGGIAGATAGSVAAAADTTAANMTKLAVAGQKWNLGSIFQPGGRFAYYAARGVPLNRIEPTDEWVFTMPGTFSTTFQGQVNSGAELDLVWDNTNKALVIDPTGTTLKHVKLLRVFAPNEVTVTTDSNVWVVCNFLPAVLY